MLGEFRNVILIMYDDTKAKVMQFLRDCTNVGYTPTIGDGSNSRQFLDEV